MSHTSKQVLSRGAINILRSCRHYAYLALQPFDYLSRAVNDKADFPPLHLRRYVGPLRSFESSGAEFMSYLKLLTGMQSDARILDIGCGCGLMALYLKDYLNQSGSYVGVDIHRPAIRWCEKSITPQHENFQFKHIDVRSLAYNPAGAYNAEDFLFPSRTIRLT